MPFNSNGSSSAVSNALRERSSTSAVVSTCPGCALPMRRAATARGLAEDRVRAAELGADLAGEDAAAADAHAQRQGVVRVRDPARSAQDPLLVLALGLRRARDQDQLAAVAVDVGLEERDAVLAGDALRGADELVAAASASSSALSLREQVVHAAEVHEGNRRLPVLGLGVPALEVAPDRRRDAPAEVEPVERRQGLEPARRARRRLEQPGRRPVPRRRAPREASRPSRR